MRRTEIARADLLDLDRYAMERRQRRRDLVVFKRDRRVIVGPHVSLHFECYETLFAQVMEMLHIERAGLDHAEDELGLFNPLIPKGNELIATMLLEIPEPEDRDRILRELVGIERCVSLRFGDCDIRAEPTATDGGTTPDGRSSGVHFLKFSFSTDQAESFSRSPARLIVAHPAYRHIVSISNRTRRALSFDL